MSAIAIKHARGNVHL